MTPACCQRALDRWSNCRHVKRRKELQRRAAVKARPAIRIVDGRVIWARDVKKGEVIAVMAEQLAVAIERSPTVGETLDAMHEHLVDIEKQLFEPPVVTVTAEPPSPEDKEARIAATITINGQQVPATIVKGVVP